MPSVLAALGVSGEPNPLALPPVRRACVLLVDGLGHEILRTHRHLAPFLAGLLPTAHQLTSAFPSTTATSLTSLGTGLPPGHHGILGYTVALPGQDRLLNQLRWSDEVDPRRWQPRRTAYQRAEAAGVTTSYVAASYFEHSSLTDACARGSHYRPADDLDAIAAQAAAALRATDRAYVFAYRADLDALGHMLGVDSDEWRAELRKVDRLAERLAAALPADAALYVTGDHGMVDVSAAGRVDVEGDPDLTAGVWLLGGDARSRYVYTHDGAAADVHAAWRDRLAGRALVVSRAEAVERGWFGPTVAPENLERIGDVIAVSYGDTALVALESEPMESRVIGMHGALTPEELDVPLLCVSGADGPTT